MNDRGFLTIAYGESDYIRMGKSLARSIRLHNKHVRLAVVTDSSDPELHALFDTVIALKPEYGTGVAQKLYVDRYSPFSQTMFIDSDCLVYRDPEELWGLYAGSVGFGVKGWGYLSRGDKHYSVANLDRYLDAYGVSRIGAFNSGLFFFDRSEAAARVFATARQIYQNRAQLDLQAFKESPVNDEPIFAMALELNSIPMLTWDDCRAMSTALGKLKGHHRINVLRGKSRFTKNGFAVEPLVIHFNIECQKYYIYRREMVRLELASRGRFQAPPGLAVIPEWAGLRLQYYRRRLSQGFKSAGIWGIVPERLRRNVC